MFYSRCFVKSYSHISQRRFSLIMMDNGPDSLTVNGSFMTLAIVSVGWVGCEQVRHDALSMKAGNKKQ